MSAADKTVTERTTTARRMERSCPIMTREGKPGFSEKLGPGESPQAEDFAQGDEQVDDADATNGAAEVEIVEVGPECRGMDGDVRAEVIPGIRPREDQEEQADVET